MLLRYFSLSGVAFAPFLSVLVGLAPAPATATPGKAKYLVEPLKEPPPSEVSKEIRAVLESSGLRVLREGKPYLDLWLCQQLETQEARPESGVRYAQIPEGSLLGVMRWHEEGSDFRGNGFDAGVCTLRSAVQPQDGDHQGVSDSRDFALLAPAKLDVKPERLPAKEAVKFSTEVSGKKHPAVLYLVPLREPAKKLPCIVEDPEREYWILDCEVRNAPADGPDADADDGGAGAKDGDSKDRGKAAPVRLGIVIEGEAQAL